MSSFAVGNVVTAFIHEGFGVHFGYAIAQAHRVNPKGRVVVLGDDINREWAIRLGAEHYDISMYSKSALEFEKIYTHMSINPVSYEIFCFKRWLILHEWWVQHEDVQGMLHLDSDVLTYASTNVLFARFQDAPFTFVDHCGHVSLIQSHTVLKAFVEYIKHWYTSDIKLSELKSIHERDTAAGWAAISDMTMFRMFHNEFPDILKDNSKPGHDRMLVDLRMNDDAGRWEMRNGIKNVKIRRGRPFVRNLLDGLEYEFLLLHFQGNSKWQMRSFVTAWTLRDRILLTGFQVLRRVGVIKARANY